MLYKAQGTMLNRTNCDFYKGW